MIHQQHNIVHIRRNILVFISLLGFTPLFAQQRGKASFYSKRATGARTASGTRLHHDSLTCAHRTYPFGTFLKVKNPANGLEVIVKVTDRGPFTRGRIIDLSWAAAKALGMLAQGVCMVEVEKVSGRGVPYRDEDDMSLPSINFELSQAGYSFIDAWKEQATEMPKITDNSPEKPSQRQEKAAVKPATATASAPAARQQGPTTGTTPANAADRKASAPASQSTGKAKTDKKEGGNIWKTIFDKVKK